MLPLPPDEADRLKALHSYQILDTVAEQAFDDLVVLAAHICNTPIALVSLVDADRQWFKAKIGLEATETPRELAFCAHAILQPDKPLVVPNTLEDERFATNPLVTSDPKIRFYAGTPITTPEGYALGTLCVIDHVSRDFNPQQVEALQALGRQVSAQIELRRNLSNLVQLNQVLQEAEANLQQAKDELEIKVEARTSELRNTNERLQSEISDRQWTEEALRESEERYALAINGANDGLWDWDLKTGSLYLSPRWKSMLGYTDDEMGSNPDAWIGQLHPEDVERVKETIAHHLAGLTSHLETEYRILHKNGIYRWMLCRGLAVRDTGKAYRLAGSQTDITQRKKAEEQLLHDAFHDSLTGLPNRALLIERLGHALELTKRREGYLFAVLFLDLDRFKTINDSLGHPIGDRLLLAFVQRLEPSLRSGDTLARLGGDEFVILLEDINSLNEATQAAQRVQELLSLPFNLNDHQIYTSASIGIALSTTEYQRPEDLLRDADTAMYRAKARGKACHEIFNSSMHIRALTLLQLENDLRRAIERQELQLYYQPIVSLTTGKLTGFEALARWQHPERGPISPSEFIPVAEETGLILPLGEWVLRCACHQMRAWQVQFSQEPPLSISMNLSARQFTQPDLIQLVIQTLQQTELAPGSLKLEITESVLMENPQAAVSMLSQLRELGIQLYIDDFGTGYSSLNYLQQFQVDALKIDRSFIAKMGVHGNNLELVQAIAMLARNLGLDVVAEGVETVEQLFQLRTIEHDSGYGQGYLFSRPVDSEGATALIAARPQW